MSKLFALKKVAILYEWWLQMGLSKTNGGIYNYCCQSAGLLQYIVNIDVTTGDHYTAHTCHQSIMKTPPDGVENAAASDSSCMFTPVLVSPISAAVAASAGRFCGVSIRGSSRQCLHSVWSAAA